jgi:hypothetical protein
VPVVVSAGWESGSLYFSGWGLRRRMNIWYGKLRKLLRRLVDERGFEPPASSLRTVHILS